MTGEVVRLWPGPDAVALDDDAIVGCYPRVPAPSLRVNFVTSVDGAVTLDGYSAGLSSPGDKRVFHLLRMICDAVLVGAGTLRHEGYRELVVDDAQRRWREAHDLPPHPRQVIVSGSLDLDPAWDVFTRSPVRPVVVTWKGAAERPGLADVADVLAVGEERVDLVAAVAALHGYGLTQLLCEGGPYLFGALTSADLVDELCLTLAPLLAGPGAGRITAGLAGPPRDLALRHVLSSDGQLLLRYTRS
jgi:riboflavin biosynthesis pyrimidine reductase